MRRLFFLVCLLSAALGAESLRVMSFNVRFPSPDDGDNRWEFRRDLLAATIREYNPDILGTQELFYEQGQYIAEKAPDYVWFGISRRGNRQDEHMGVFYKKDKFRLVDSGNFWLSETPETPGSMSWNVSLPRMVTWGLFEIKASGRRFYYYNTHFPHRPQDAEARLQCAAVILERISRLPKDLPFILTGDFNSAAGGDVYKLFSAHLKDSWETALKRSGPEGTSGGFKGSAGGRRIDWILYRGPFRVLEAATVTRNEDGRYPSDHFPVFALFDF
jgi:endonuclease/exonuclease/phosphatase family metal-dependent hydrolase